MRPPLLLAALLLLATATSSPCAPPPRPYSGCGVLALGSDPGGERGTLVLYREPGLERVGEAPFAALPRLSGGEETLVAVAARRGDWCRVAYDEAGREGWVEQARRWSYLPWDEFLPGRRVRALPGLKKGLYAVRSEPAEGGREQGRLAPEQAARVVRTEEDWALIEAPSGWVRWRDSDGRLTISLHDR